MRTSFPSPVGLHALIITALVVSLATGASVATEVVMGNPSAIFTGTWLTGTSADDKYGPDYCYIMIGSQLRTATFYPNVPTSGQWDVYTWYTQGAARYTSVEYTVHTALCDDIKYVDQQVNGGQWNHLGTYTFAPGLADFVMLSNRGSDTNKIVVADAMKFTYVGPIPEPSSLLALGGGMLGLAGLIRRRRSAI